MPERVELDIWIATYPRTRKLAPIADDPLPHGPAPDVKIIDALRLAPFEEGFTPRPLEVGQILINPENL